MLYITSLSHSILLGKRGSVYQPFFFFFLIMTDLMIDGHYHLKPKSFFLE